MESDAFSLKALRAPVLRRKDELKFVLDAFTGWRLFFECLIIVFITLVFVLYFKAFMGLWGLVIPGMIICIYFAVALRMVNEGGEVAFDKKTVSIRVADQELNAVVKKVLCVSLSGSEDSFYNESGSCRIYIKVDAADGKSGYIPLVISSVSPKCIGRELSKLVECEYSEGKGLAALPTQLFSAPLEGSHARASGDTG